MRKRWLMILVSAGLLQPACAGHGTKTQAGDDTDASTATKPSALEPTSDSARDAVKSLRTRFVRVPKLIDSPPTDALLPRDLPEPVIPPGVASGFERDGRVLRPVIKARIGRPSLAREAKVTLPDRADGEVRIADEKAGMEIGFMLDRAAGGQVEVADGLAVYRRAGPFGSQLIHRPNVEGTEDFVVFDEKPPAEELRYQVDVSRVPGLRLVDDTLEFLNAKGAPVLRIAPPYVSDRDGDRHAAKLSVEGCAYDTDLRGPWDRPVTAPGADRCTVKVTWHDVTYPAVVDPAWQTTGSMATARRQHTANLLNNGWVLVAGGYDGSSTIKSSEYFNPGASPAGWSSAGLMATARYDHASLLLSDGRVLVCGGQGSIASCERFTLGSGWATTAGSLATGRSRFTMSFLNSGSIIVAGGFNGSPVGSVEKSTDIYGSSWTSLGSLPVARYAHTATRVGSVTVFAGGMGASALSSVDRYSESGGFGSENAMSGARYDHIAWTDGSGAVFVAGGYPSTALKTEKLSGSGGTWATQGAFNQGRLWTTFAKDYDWVIGGYTGSNWLNTVERYQAGSWVTQQSLVEARAQNTVTKFATGLLVAGGRNSSVALASAELHAAQAPLGTPCVDAGDCASGFCIDGVCCDTACGATCYACTAALKGYGSDGYCAAQASGKTCGPGQTCTNGVQTVYACNGSGSCVSNSSNCEPYVCLGNGCLSDCDGSADCHPNYYCDNGTAECVAKKANGDACSSGGVCLSTFCVDSYCCDSACTGNCAACSAIKKGQGTNGVCGFVKLGLDPDGNCAYSAPATCGLDGNCNGAGACAYWPSGTSCGASTCSAGILTRVRLLWNNGVLT